MSHRFTTPPRRGRTPSKPGAVTAQVQSLTRGLNILEALAKAEAGISLTDIAQRVDLPPSTTHRLLSTLEKMGYVYQAGDLGHWYVGLQAFTVGAGFLANRDFVGQSHVHMRRLMEQSGETANLAILDGTEAVFIAQVQCREMMRILVKLGSRVPLHASGVGKAMLSAMPPREADELVGRVVGDGVPGGVQHSGRQDQDDNQRSGFQVHRGARYPPVSDPRARPGGRAGTAARAPLE